MPDGVWILGDKLFIGYEAKTEQDAAGAISVTDARQAGGHANWIRNEFGCDADATVTCILITPREEVDSAAVPHAGSLFLILPSEVIRLVQEGTSMLRAIRSEAAGCRDDQLSAVIAKRCREAHLTPSEILERLQRLCVRELPQR